MISTNVENELTNLFYENVYDFYVFAFTCGKRVCCVVVSLRKSLFRRKSLLRKSFRRGNELPYLNLLGPLVRFNGQEAERVRQIEAPTAEMNSA